VVEADEKRLRQVLLNLLGNAVKFTDAGEVTLDVRRVSGGDTRVLLAFEVRDSGVGIAAEHLETIFLPFEQVGNAERRAGGTGLGLAISRNLVRAMGGDIHVDSRPGAGSCFAFELSLVSLQAGHVAQPAMSFATGYDGPRRSVLVVDDVVASRRMLADLLGPLGFQVSEAVDGQHALHQMERTCPDLVLMDMAMPVMDGMEATRRIRQNPAWRRLPVVALSAHASNSDRLMCMEAGADAYLSKPFDRDALLLEIGNLLSLDWQRQPPATRGGVSV